MAEQRRHTEIGPAGDRLAENLRRLRIARDMTTEDVSRALKGHGAAIPASSVTKLEKRQRRATVDELAALAAVLAVHPVTLLLPPARASTSEEIKDFVAARILERPYVVHVHGHVTRPDAVALYIGEAAVDLDRGVSRGEGA